MSESKGGFEEDLKSQIKDWGGGGEGVGQKNRTYLFPEKSSSLWQKKNIQLRIKSLILHEETSRAPCRRQDCLV